jgi:hypothetical protein
MIRFSPPLTPNKRKDWYEVFVLPRIKESFKVRVTMGPHSETFPSAKAMTSKGIDALLADGYTVEIE